MTAFPPAAQARIERVLAALELAVIVALKTPAPAIPNDGGLVFIRLHAPTEPLILEALHAIVTIISDLPWTATERREAVTAYRDQLATLYEMDRPSFIAAVRAEPWWQAFQRLLGEAERTDIRSLGQQLTDFLREVHWKDEDLAAATQVNPKTVERHRMGTQLPGRNTRTAYERALSAVRGPTCFVLPPTAPAKRRPRAPRLRRPKKS